MNLSVPVNTEATLSCQVRTEPGEQLGNISWEGPMSPIPYPTMDEQNGITTSNLTVNLTADYVGEYRCIAKYRDCNVTVTSLSGTLTILPPVQILLLPVDQLRMPGDDVAFTCVSTNDGTVSIEWTGPQGNLMGSQVDLENNVTSTLTLTGVESSIGGQYTCSASNEAGRDSATAVLYISPVVTPNRTRVNVNESVTLTCVVQDPALGVIQWEKMDNAVFQPQDNEQDRTLTIQRVRYNSHGTYRCSVDTYLFGVLNSTVSLIVGTSYSLIPFKD